MTGESGKGSKNVVGVDVEKVEFDERSEFPVHTKRVWINGAEVNDIAGFEARIEGERLRVRVEFWADAMEFHTEREELCP